MVAESDLWRSADQIYKVIIDKRNNDAFCFRDFCLSNQKCITFYRIDEVYCGCEGEFDISDINYFSEEFNAEIDVIKSDFGHVTKEFEFASEKDLGYCCDFFGRKRHHARFKIKKGKENKMLWLQHGGISGRKLAQIHPFSDYVICCYPELYSNEIWFDKHLMKECYGTVRVCGENGSLTFKLSGYQKL